MKKLIFSLMFMFVGVFAFAESKVGQHEPDGITLNDNSIKQELDTAFEPCCVWIVYTNEDGSTDEFHAHYDVADPENCDAFANDIACAFYC